MRALIAIATAMTAAAGGSCSLDDYDTTGAREIERVELPPQPASNSAVTAVIADESGAWFLGGSDNPYNEDGIGYHGGPSQPMPGTFARDFESNEWFEFGIADQPTMDRRGPFVCRESLVRVGGMLSDREVTDAVYGGGEE